MIVIVGDSRGERHRSWHPNLSQGDNERLLFIGRNYVAHDAAFVAGIRQVRDDVPRLTSNGNMLRPEIIDQRWHKFDFKRHGRLERSQ